MGNRNYNRPLIRPPLRTVTGWGNDPMHLHVWASLPSMIHILPSPIWNLQPWPAIASSTSIRSSVAPCSVNGGCPKLRVPFFEGPHNKEFNILGSILGSPYLGKPPKGLHDAKAAEIRRPSEQKPLAPSEPINDANSVSPGTRQPRLCDSF